MSLADKTGRDVANSISSKVLTWKVVLVLIAIAAIAVIVAIPGIRGCVNAGGPEFQPAVNIGANEQGEALSDLRYTLSSDSDELLMERARKTYAIE